MKHPDPLFATVESFFTDYLQRTRGSSPCTLTSYRDTVRLFLDYAARVRGGSSDRLRLADFNPDLVVDFLEYLERDRRNSVSTRNHRLAVLRSFFTHALRRHPDHAGNLARIVALRPKRHALAPPRYLDPSAVQLLLRHPDRQKPAGRRDYALLLFLYNTGARVSEAVGFRHKDLLPGPAATLHGKGRKERVCPLWPESVAAIKAISPAGTFEPDAPVFQNARGHGLTRHGAYHILSKHAQAVHLSDPRFPEKVWPHLLRHSCAVALLQAGVDLTVIRDHLGHVSIATTSRYATSNLKLKRTALEAFWAATGMSQSRTKRWHPSTKLSQFLQSI